MTGASEAAQSRHASRWTLLAQSSALPLVFLAIVVPFLRFHRYDLLLPESLILMGGAVTIGGVASVLALLRSRLLGPFVTAIALAIYAAYQPPAADRLLTLAGGIARAIDSGAVALGVVSLLLVFALFLVCWTIRAHLLSVVAAIFGTIVVSSLVLPASEGGAVLESGAIPTEVRDLPPVVQIILDEHIGLAALPPELDESVSAAREIRNTYKDFALYERAYSRFSETQYALASLMNNAPGADVIALLGEKRVGHALLRSEWFERLKEQGYALKVYQTDWLDMCGQIRSVDACYTYPLYSLNSIQRSPLTTAARIRTLLGKLNLVKETALATPLAAGEALDRFQADIAKAPRGVAYIVHLVLPHYGYLYRDDCSLMEPQDWKDQPVDKTVVYSPEERLRTYGYYLPQLICTQLRMQGLFEHLRKLGIYDEATIIVHGDHGSRIGQRTIHADAKAMTDRDLLDHHSTLLAIKSAGIAPGRLLEPASLQRVFSETFLGKSPTAAPPPGEVLVSDETPGIFTPRTLVWGMDDGAQRHPVTASANGAAVTPR